MQRTSKSPEVVAIFNRVKSFVIERLSEGDPTFDRVKLLHCPEVMDSCPKGQRERAYAHVGHWPGTVCADVTKFAKLPIEHQVGILLHEFGHIGDPFAGEAAADQWVFNELGIALQYKGPLTLQWVSKADIRKFGI